MNRCLRVGSVGKVVSCSTARRVDRLPQAKEIDVEATEDLTGSAFHIEHAHKEMLWFDCRVTTAQ